MAPAALWVYRTILTASLPVLAPYFLLQARKRGRDRPPLSQRLGRRLPPLPVDGVWIQAVSVGEVAVARPVLAELRRRHPTLGLTLSSTTATGLRLASGQQLADAVVPFPIDLPGPIQRVLDLARPRLVILIETELWPELLAQCGRRRIPVALVNARVSERSFRSYRLVRSLLQPLLQPISQVLAQDDADARRFAELGVPGERIRVVGNIKFDASPPGAPSAVLGSLTQLAGDRPILVAGSTVAGEESLVLEAWLALARPQRPLLVMAPRHPERAGEVLDLATERGLAAVRRTRIEAAPAPCDLVVLDTIGELAAVYQLARVAFVGGSLVPVGGHNPIEPAHHGVPVLTGPHVRNFVTIYRELFKAGAARVVNTSAQMAELLSAWLEDPEGARQAGEAGRVFLGRHAGVTRLTVDALEPFLA